MTKEFGVAIIGCGNISTAYFTLVPLYKNLKLVACSDLNPEAAQAQAQKFGVVAQSIEELLANRAVDVVVNLTIPTAHFAVSKQVLEAGKHVYSEKPFVLSLEEGEALRAIADMKGLRVGSAPDTFLGGAHQFARSLIEAGKVGEIKSGTAHVLSPGMEMWHPNPDFFFKPGGGPILDMGPYYVTNLLNLVGPVKRVMATANKAKNERIITNGPRDGEAVPVEVPTNIHAILAFENGACISLMASWDVWSSEHRNMELYGTDGSIYVPDPNFFSGQVEFGGAEHNVVHLAQMWDHPLGFENWDTPHGKHGNFRAAGLSDMMAGFAENRDHRCSLDRALHVVDVLLSILKSAQTETSVNIQTRCSQPAPLGVDEARAMLR